MNPHDQQPLARRTVLAGAGTAGALAAAAALLPARQATDLPPGSTAKATPEQTPGYRLTEHVMQYYRSARV